MPVFRQRVYKQVQVQVSPRFQVQVSPKGPQAALTLDSPKQKNCSAQPSMLLVEAMPWWCVTWRSGQIFFSRYKIYDKQ
jgi:hypothetical protein